MRFTTLDLALISDQPELAVPGADEGLPHPMDIALVGHAIANDFGDGQNFQVVSLAEIDQIGHAGHGPVIPHDLADDPSWNQSGKSSQIHGSFGLSSTHENDPLAGAKREDMPWACQIRG